MLAWFNELIFIADAVVRIPEDVAYGRGSAWRAIPFKLVPRLVWRDKPDVRRIYESDWAIRFGYKTPAHYERTAVNLPLPVDGYWNFGILGVVFVSLVAGVATGLLYLINRTDRAATFAIGLTILVGMRFHGSFGKVVGNLIPQYLLLVASIILLNLLARAITTTLSALPRAEADQRSA